MKKLITYLWLGLLSGIVLAGCAQPIDSTVSMVYDGDSFVMSNGDEIRLIGIDAPERDEPGADEARAFLINLIEGKQIRLEPDKEDKDKYHRLLRYAYLGETFINAEMIKQGYAKTLFIPPNDQYRTEFTRLAATAKETSPGLGLGTKQETPKEIMVYVTSTGKKYHRAGCSSLSKTKIPMALEKARKDYLPCKQCHPPK